MTKSPPRSILLKLALPIYLPTIILAIGQGMNGVVIPLFAMKLTGSYGAASTVFAMMGVGILLTDVPAGMLVSRIGHKAAMILGMVVVVMAAIVAGFAGSILILGAVALFFGAGRGIMMLARLTYITDATDIVERGRAIATIGGMMRVGGFIGPILGGFTAKYYGFEITMILSGIVTLGALIFVIIFLSREKTQSVVHSTNPFVVAGKIFSTHRSTFLTAGSAVVGLQLLRSGRGLLVPLWGISIGLDAAEIGLISGIPMGLEMTMFYPVGMIMDRIGRKWMAVPCILLLSIGMALIPFCHSFYPFLFVIILAAIGNGFGSGIVQLLGADFSPEAQRSDFLGVWRLVGDLGFTAGPFIIGIITEVFVLSFACYATAGIGLIGTFIMIFLVEETRKK
jgi:MFS family permease